MKKAIGLMGRPWGKWSSIIWGRLIVIKYPKSSLSGNWSSRRSLKNSWRNAKTSLRDKFLKLTCLFKINSLNPDWIKFKPPYSRSMNPIYVLQLLMNTSDTTNNSLNSLKVWTKRCLRQINRSRERKTLKKFEISWIKKFNSIKLIPYLC